MKDLGALMKQMQDMQAKMQTAQEEIANLEVTGQAGGGLVSVTLSGAGDIRSVTIDPSLANPDEVDVLEDLLVAAFNEGKRKADTEAQAKMKDAAGGLGGLGDMLPPGLKLPF